MKKYILFWMLFSLFNGVNAQLNTIINYTSSNTGSNPLPSNSIGSLTFDPSNTAWLNTNFGVILFDGSTWSPFETPDSIHIFSAPLVSDNDGKIYFGGYNEIYIYDPFLETWTTISLNLPSSSPSSVVKILIASNEVIWIGTQSGIVTLDNQQINYYSTANGLSSDLIFDIIETSDQKIWVSNLSKIDIWDGSTWTSIDPNQTIRMLFEDSNGNIWCGGNNIFKYDGTNWTYYDLSLIPQYVFNNCHITSITQDDLNNMYFCFESNGILKFVNQNWTWLNDSNYLPGNWVNIAVKDNLGRIWFGFDSAGLLIYDGTQYLSYTTADGLCESFVSSIFEDSSNKIWFLSFDGVSSLSTGQWNSYLQDPMQDTPYGSIDQNSGNQICVGSHNYIHRWDGGSWEEIFGLSNVFDISDLINIGTDTIYIGHHHGFTRAIGPNFNYGSAWLDYTGLPDNFVNTLALGPDNRIWIGTNNGLAFTNGQIIVEETIPGELISNKINDLVFDFQNRLWVATDHGVGIFDGALWSFITEYDGLINNNVLCLEQTRDSAMWFGTAQGAALLKDSTWQYLTQTDGLLNDSILCIEEDHLGNVWFGTYKGVSELMADTTNSNGIHFSQQDNSLNLYPNPASNKLYFKSRDSGVAKIFSQSGRLLLESNVLPGQNQLYLTSLPPGNYFLQVVGNKTSWVGKFVVMR